MASFLSQFPLWDFVECNLAKVLADVLGKEFISQFPLWDFGECNLKSRSEAVAFAVRELLSIPFVGFR
jgi:hypothetical protein